MSFPLWFWIIFSYAAITIFSTFGSQEPTPDATQLNRLGNTSVIQVQEPTFGSNPISSGIELIKWGAKVGNALVTVLSWDTPFWRGDLNAVRWGLLSALGFSALAVLAYDTARLIRG